MNILTNLKTHNKTQQLSNGANVLVNTLIKGGVDTVFGYPGTPVLSLYEELSKTKQIKHYLNRHEQGSVHSAEGYARVSGKCGVVLTTSGAGFTNTITGIMSANSDFTPILVITIHTENLGKNEFQEVDIQSVVKSCAKKAYVVTKTEDIEKITSQALIETEKLPKGVVVLAITKSALEGVEEQKTYRNKQEIKVEAPHSCVLKTLDILKNSSRPLIIVGGGCVDAESELSEFIRLTQIPVVHTLMGKGIVDLFSLGMIGFNGDNSLNNIINDSDVVLALGTRFTDRTTNYKKKYLPNTKIISVNINQNTSKNVKIDKEIVGEMSIVLQQMIGVIKAKKVLFDIKYDWIDRLNNIKSVHNNKNSEYSANNIIDEIYNYTKIYNPIVTTDVGEHQMLVSRIFKTNSSRNFVTSGGFGTMGFGLPAAIGASIAKPNVPVLNITGDGSFQMNMQELATCAEYELPIKIFIMNNSSLKMIENQQKLNNYAIYQSKLLNPDFVKISESYGILGYRITSMEDLKNSLTSIFKYKKPVVLDIRIDS